MGDKMKKEKKEEEEAAIVCCSFVFLAIRNVDNFALRDSHETQLHSGKSDEKKNSVRHDKYKYTLVIM